MEIVIYCLATAALTAAVLGFYLSHARKQLRQSLDEATQTLRNLEKEIHQKETELLRNKNQFEAELTAQTQNLIKHAKLEGQTLGHEDAEKNYRYELKKLEITHREAVTKERAEAAEDARKSHQLAFEQQVKMFSIKISPFVKVIKDSGWVFNSHVSEIGYQYQLLVNGIPAFSPHITIERSEEIKEIDEDKLSFLMDQAKDLTKMAADTYLKGSGAGAVLMAEPILNVLEKKQTVK